MPASSPPPPSGAITASTSGRSSTISRPIGAVAADEVRRRRTDGRSARASDRSAWRFDRAPAFVVRRLDDRGAEPLDGAQLGRRARCPSPCTLHAAPALRAASATPCAALPALTVQTPPASCAGVSWRDGVVGAADLERADRLQRFELEVRSPGRRAGARQLEPHERRADGRVVDRRRRRRGWCRERCAGSRPGRSLRSTEPTIANPSRLTCRVNEAR